MATDPEYFNLFANAGEEQQKLMLFVDMLLIDGTLSEIIVVSES